MLNTAWIAMVSVLGAPAGDVDNWPQFRGPRGDGHTNVTHLPLKWSEKENVAWKTAIHDVGWSSPVIWGNQIWMTTAEKKSGKQVQTAGRKQTRRAGHGLSRRRRKSHLHPNRHPPVPHREKTP